MTASAKKIKNIFVTSKYLPGSFFVKTNMVEAIKIINTDVKRDYTLRDGHFLRGCYANLQRHLSYSFPGLYMRYIPDHGNAVQSWWQKRNMMRIRRDGKH